MTARVHLELLSKQQLIRRAREALSEAAYWRTRFAAITAFDVPDDATPEEVTMIAAKILQALPEDPMAWRHRDDLLAALAEDRPLRCHRDGCRHPLDGKGRCSRHDWRVRAKDRREQVPA